MQGIKHKLIEEKSYPKELQTRASPSPNLKKQALLFSSILRTWSDMFKEEKDENQKLRQVPVPTHPRSMNLKTRTRRYGKNIKAMCSLKSALDRLQRRSRRGITHSTGVRWGE
jgi:hypothetical protein